MTTMMISLLFFIAGLLTGGLINVLADDLPARIRPGRPHCPQCGHVHNPAGWLAVGRRLQGGACPQCGLVTRRRALLVEVGTAVIFALLPLFIQPEVDLVIYSFYMAVLILVIVIDIEHRLILHVVTIPSTIIALIASLPLSQNSFRLALVGAVLGFILFYLAYLLGRRLFGPGALGFGDVMLAMMLGAMLGLQIIFVLILAILLGGLFGIVALLSGRIGRGAYFAYGPFLAVAGMVMIIWGPQFLEWYLNP
jgi:prepilin signal peptidase PulO-like enzyme (type II secretory pathway)